MSVTGTYIVVLVTCSSKEEAEKIGKALIEHKLAVCINIIGNIDSYFWWRGRANYAKEFLLIIKTKIDALHGLIKFVKSVHSYETPEIIALPIIAGLSDYLRWIDDGLK